MRAFWRVKRGLGAMKRFRANGLIEGKDKWANENPGADFFISVLAALNLHNRPAAPA